MKNQNISVGDRFLCKETFFEGTYTYFHSNKYCNIYFIQKDDPYEYYYISDENFKKYPFRFSEERLFTYFYTSQEIRAIKMKKIYEEAKY